MNDERFLKDWLQDTTDDTPDSQASADRILARVPEIKQRSRWWPWLPGRRRPDSETPSSPQGRTRLMLSPVKAVTAGALVLAIGATFLVAQPFEQRGSLPGAEQAADPAPPVKVTATFVSIDCDSPSGSSEGNFEPDGLLDRYIGRYCTVDNEWSDPRLQGSETYLENGVEYMDDSELFVAHYVHDIVNDDGAWRMRPHFHFHSADGTATPSGGMGAFSATWVLDGEGAYEGLSVVLAKDGADIDGYIVSTDLLPPAPEGSTTK